MRRGRLVLFSCAASSQRMIGSAFFPTALMRSRAAPQPFRAAGLLPWQSRLHMSGGTGSYEEETPAWVTQAAQDNEFVENLEPKAPKNQQVPLHEREVRPIGVFEATLEMPKGTCSGCGARYQCTDIGAPGYVPEHVLAERVAAVKMDSQGIKVKGAVCQRCHGLRHNNKLPANTLRAGLGDESHEELRSEHFIRLLSDISTRRCVVVAIVDLFDFHGSLVPELPTVVGKDNDLILVGNKFDLLPPNTNVKATERWMRAEARKANLSQLHSVHLVSCRTVTMPAVTAASLIYSTDAEITRKSPAPRVCRRYRCLLSTASTPAHRLYSCPRWKNT